MNCNLKHKFIHIRISALSESIILAYISKRAVVTAARALMNLLHRGEFFLSAKAYVDLIEEVMKIFMAVLTLTAIVCADSSFINGYGKQMNHLFVVASIKFSFQAAVHS